MRCRFLPCLPKRASELSACRPAGRRLESPSRPPWERHEHEMTRSDLCGRRAHSLGMEALKRRAETKGPDTRRASLLVAGQVADARVIPVCARSREPVLRHALPGRAGLTPERSPCGASLRREPSVRRRLRGGPGGRHPLDWNPPQSRPNRGQVALRPVPGLLGRRDVSTTRLHTHVLNKGSVVVTSPPTEPD